MKVHTAIMFALEYYFYNSAVHIKATVYTIFLIGLYLKAISRYILPNLYESVNVLATGMLLSSFLVVVLNIKFVRYQPGVTNA